MTEISTTKWVLVIVLGLMMLSGCGTTMTNGRMDTETETDAQATTGKGPTETGDMSACMDLKPFVNIRVSGWGRPESLECRKWENFYQINATFRFAKHESRYLAVSDCKAYPGGAGAFMEKMFPARESKPVSTMVSGFKALGTFNPNTTVPLSFDSGYSGGLTVYGMGQGYLAINVGDRFVIKVWNGASERVKSLKDLESAAAQMDLKKLASLAPILP